jgi:SAM-dependent methyltransferase
VQPTPWPRRRATTTCTRPTTSTHSHHRTAATPTSSNQPPRDLIDDLAPSGHVLELACGPGGFTAELARHATTVTVIDASAQMLARNRAEVDRHNIGYVHADIFDWRPDRSYDLFFFGFWLSHVPPVCFDDFGQLVRSCVRSESRVAFVDESDRGMHNDDVRVVDAVPLVATDRSCCTGPSGSRPIYFSPRNRRVASSSGCPQTAA